jgi:glucose 1-dehydrogenase
MPQTQSEPIATLSSQRLAGRRAPVTGGATGIGRATAQRLVSDGVAVIVNYVGAAEAATELVDELGSSGGTAHAVRADVSHEDEVVNMFAEASTTLGGPIDLLVNNAGVEKPFRLIDMPLDEWNRVLSVNCSSKGAMKLFAQTIAREPAPHGIRVVNVAPGAILTPRPTTSRARHSWSTAA